MILPPSARRRIARAAALVVAGALSLPATGVAAGGPRTTPAAATTRTAPKPAETRSAPTPAEATAAAREHASAGMRLYNLNRYDEALAEFEAAYQLRDDPVLLYNIGQCHRMAKRFPEATRAYRSYLRNFPAAKNKEEVEQRIREMEEEMAAAEKHAAEERAAEEARVAAQGAAAAALAQKQNAPHPGRSRIIAGAVVGAAGLAIIGGGVALGLIAQEQGSTQSKNAIFDNALDASGKSLTAAGLALDAVGGLAVAAGVGVMTWGLLRKRPEAAPAPSAWVVPTLGSRGGGASLVVRY